MSLKKASALIFLFVIGTFILYLGVILYLTWPISSITFDRAGLFGDSFGILTSLFSGLAFAGLIITILLQREELRESREIFRKQRFEDAFYRLLDFYHRNLESVIILDDDGNVKHKGVSALKALLQNFSDSMSGFVHYLKSEEHRDLYTYHLFREIQKALSPQSRYLGTLESMLSLIESELDSEKEKSIYTNIVATQLTSYEARYLFYHCMVASDRNNLRELVHCSPGLLDRITQVNISKRQSEIYEQIHGVKIKRTRKKSVMPFNKRQKIEIRKRHKELSK